MAKLQQCIVVTCFAENQPGYLDFSYRITSLARTYDLTIISQDGLTQSELLVPDAKYVVMGRRNGKYGWLRYLWQCATYVRRQKPALLVLLHSSAAPMTLLVGGVPACLYWNEHPTNLMHLPAGFSPFRTMLTRLCHRLVFAGAKHADLVMPIGEEHQEDLLANGCKPNRVKLVYMGVADAFSRNAAQKNADGRPLELIYIGTVSAPRGRDVMLEGVAQAAHAGCDVRLTLVGADEGQQEYCRTKARELGIPDRIDVLGRIPGSAIPGLLAKADAGVCLWEDQPWWRFNPPTKLFEYLAAGLPVLASDIRTHTRYIESWNNGLIFKYGAQGLADAIGKIIASRAQLTRMQQEAFLSGQSYLWSRIEPIFLDNVAGMLRTGT